MAQFEDLVPRQYYRCRSGWSYRNGRCQRNRWNHWGRWVLAGVVIAVFVLFLFCCLCLSRRRKRRGVKPVYGTGWMANGFNKNNNQHQMNQGGYNYGQQNGFNGAPPPPAYGQPQQQQYTGNTFNSNEGYYGQGHDQGQYSGVQAPQGTYQRDDPYGPPPGPPPGK